jgi:hypothetical protein
MHANHAAQISRNTVLSSARADCRILIARGDHGARSQTCDFIGTTSEPEAREQDRSRAARDDRAREISCRPFFGTATRRQLRGSYAQPGRETEMSSRCGLSGVPDWRNALTCGRSSDPPSASPISQLKFLFKIDCLRNPSERGCKREQTATQIGAEAEFSVMWPTRDNLSRKNANHLQLTPRRFAPLA